MAKGAYIGVNGVAKKIKKGYIGVNGVARKIKKAYIGVGGVARPCWAGGELAYYGTVTGIYQGVQALSATSIGEYALFGGGETTGSNKVSSVCAYNKSLVRSTPASLSTVAMALAATAIGEYALFGGGGNSSIEVSTVNTYNRSLTKSTATSLQKGRSHLAAASNPNYAIFTGGEYYDYDWEENYISNHVDAYNASLTRSTTTMSATMFYHSGASTGNYALFGGGWSSGTVVNAYNTSLTRSIPTSFSYNPDGNNCGGSIGDYAVFAAGGVTGSSKVVNAYNSSLTRSIPSQLSVSRSAAAAVTLDKYLLIGGGTSSTVVDVYDASLTKVANKSISKGRIYLAATSNADYALFGGGRYDDDEGDSYYVTTVDAYTIV